MIIALLTNSILRAVFGSPDAGRAAEKFQWYAARRGFRTFRDPRFRAAVAFDSLGITEQDRMFNELLCSNLVLQLLMLETVAFLAGGAAKQWCVDVAQTIPERFAATLRGPGVDEKNIKLWIKLIGFRKDEYEQQRLESRSSLPEFGEGNPWVRVVGIGCLFHIRRGKSIPNDPLLPLFMDQALDVAISLERAVRWAARRL